MQIVGMFIKNIVAKKYEDEIKNLKVNNNTKINSVKEQDISALGRKGLNIDFDFSTEYKNENKKIAEISISGNVYVIDNDYEKLLELWKKENRLPDEVNINVLNAILRKCFIKSLLLTEELQLPSPIPMPYASLNKE